MTATSIPAIYKNSIIVFKNETYRVKRLNSKSIAITDAAGKEFKLTLPSEYAWNNTFREAYDDEAAAFREKEFSRVLDPVNVLRVGNVVRWPACTHAMGKGKLLVVTKVNAEGAANLVPLGGVLTLQYFRSVPSVLLEKVEGAITVTNA